jgi:uracil-DNA glycosylase
MKNKIELPEKWQNHFPSVFDNQSVAELLSKVTHEYEQFPDAVFPAIENVFKAFELCDPDNIKVVILGQDPYPTKGHAHGLAFSVVDDLKVLPKSLQNIYKEIKNEYPDFDPKNGNLQHWAEQGVLLLNSILTVKESQPGSHSELGWQAFTDSLIEHLDKEYREIVFVFWGAYAQSKKKIIKNSKALILESPHPSPLSAYRGFFGCNHFKQINTYLEDNDIKLIRW